MENCFVCDAYFYPITIESATEDEEVLLDPTTVANFCESMDLAPPPEGMSVDRLPMCHRCTITSSKILLLQEQIKQLQNMVSDFQYTVAEKTLITYHHTKESLGENSADCDDGSTIHLVRLSVRERWEEDEKGLQKDDESDVKKDDEEGGGSPQSRSDLDQNEHEVTEVPSTSTNEKEDDGEDKDSAGDDSNPSLFFEEGLVKLAPSSSYLEADDPDEKEDSSVTRGADQNEDNEEYMGNDITWDDDEDEHMENNTFDNDSDNEVEVVGQTTRPLQLQTPLLSNGFRIITNGGSISNQILAFSNQANLGNNGGMTLLNAVDGSSSTSMSSFGARRKLLDRRTRVCPFPECGKEFTNPDRYTEHINVHNGNAPSCHICQKVFPRKYNLRIHMRTHTGEKPHKCPICQQKYADKSNLNAHIRKHYEKPFHCFLCRRMFDDVSSAQSHVVTFHPDRKERNLIRFTRVIQK